MRNAPSRTSDIALGIPSMALRAPRPNFAASCLMTLALLVAVVASPLGASPVRRSAPATSGAAEGAGRAAANEACSTPDGVTVVIDFQDLGGGVNVRCAPGAVGSGLDALDRAGISYQTALRSPGFVCRIAGLPADDPCHVASPASAYWSYWIAGRGGTWCYSNLGAGSRTPPPGSIEGWSFSLHRSGRSTPPPRFAVPAPFPGGQANPIPANQCTTPSEGPVATVPQPAPAPAPTVGSTEPAPAPDPDGSLGPDGGVSGTSLPPHGGGSGSAPQAEGDTAPDTGEDSEAQPSSTVPAASGADTGAGPADAAGQESPGSDVAGTVDLSSDGSSSGSPVPLIAAVVILAALGLVGFTVSRRRLGHRTDAPGVERRAST
ncbi:MAG: hypothetical protein IPG97_09210 [Microthrixaceae bacterium]|nr:hypothetical protein [Microthrixaceae bacterium]